MPVLHRMGETTPPLILIPERSRRMARTSFVPPGLWRPNEEPLWELFHENSKSGRFDHALPASYVGQRMRDMAAAFHYEQAESISLPEVLTPLIQSFEEVLFARVSSRTLRPVPLSLETIATLLHGAYGVTRSNSDTIFPRPFRTIPSAGALYPLELYFHTVCIETIPSGLYHYDPTHNAIQSIREGDGSRLIADALVQGEIASDSAMLVFITAAFERATFKYGERGYRFALLEAGHLAQNLCLVSTALGLGALPIGGYFDRLADAFLQIDGVEQSTVYMVAIGGLPDEEPMQVPTVP